jgi:CRISPR-associated protein Cas1
MLENLTKNVNDVVILSFVGFNFKKTYMENKLLYITQSGTLSRKDNTLFFENEKIKKIIPIVGIEQIYCLWEVNINSKLLQYLTENKIAIHFFNYYGYYTGSYYPKESYVSWKLLIKQVEHYTDLEKRLKIAKSFVFGIGKNQIYLLKHYYKHWKSVKRYLQAIENNLKDLEKANTPNQVLMIEWTSWDLFYNSFKHFLPEEFVLNKRVKRPPDNPINALISFWNSVLYTYTLSKLYHTQLNPTISYLHEPFERRFSLALDLAEVFKMPLVFSVIFSLVNKKMLKVEKHFLQEANYAVLNEEWRRIYLKAWDEKVQKVIKHPKLKRNISYGSLIKLDAYKLIKYLIADVDNFEPFDLETKI